MWCGPATARVETIAAANGEPRVIEGRPPAARPGPRSRRTAWRRDAGGGGRRLPHRRRQSQGRPHRRRRPRQLPRAEGPGGGTGGGFTSRRVGRWSPPGSSRIACIHLILSLSKDEVFHRACRGLVLRQAQDEAECEVGGSGRAYVHPTGGVSCPAHAGRFSTRAWAILSQCASSLPLNFRWKRVALRNSSTCTPCGSGLVGVGVVGRDEDAVAGLQPHARAHLQRPPIT